MLKPFRQLPFAEVPDAPRLPHGYFDARAETVTVRTAAFGDVKTHVRVHGSGPPLLLVHGFMTTGYSWRYAMRPLGERFTLYIPDLVGCGRSAMPDAPYTPENLADWLDALVDVLAIRGAPAIGNSMGGYLGLHLALRHPDALSRLVNLHSPGLPTGRMKALRTALDVVPRWPEVLRWMVQRDPERWVHRNVHYFDETLKSREEHREYGRPLATPEGVRAFARMLDETMDVRAMARFEATLRGRRALPIPLQLVYARRDPMVPPSVGERMAALLPGAERVWLDDASHFAHVDATDAFVRAALPFLTAGR
jgi:pimeloyl-ACP methyl ester carboxylesterase